MANVFFVSGNTTTFGTQFTPGTPTGFMHVTANDTQTAFNRLQTLTNCEAIFVYFENTTGTTGNFNGQQFINFVRGTAGYANTPIFIVVPTTLTSEATGIQKTTGTDGFVTWDTNNPTGFWNQVRETLNRFNIQAA